MKTLHKLTGILFALFPLFVQTATAQGQNVKPRTVVTSDGEIDDMDSFIRFLLYTNELDVEGLIYTSSMWHYAGDGKGTPFISEMPMTKNMYGSRTFLRWVGTHWMQDLIDQYAKVYTNLLKHDPAYPSPEALKSKIRIGNIDFEGEMDHDTPGSDLIRQILLDDNPGPVYIECWGGTNTAARALKSIEDIYGKGGDWQQIRTKISDKAVLYIILDQDATYKNYVAVHWPDIQVIDNTRQFGSLAYWWYRVVPPALIDCLEGPWFAANIKFNHGPLLERYFLWGDGQKADGDPEDTQGSMEETSKQHRKQYDFISEGDSPSFLFLLDFGLNPQLDPTFGGLGGRFAQSKQNPHLWEDGNSVTDLDPYTGKQEISYPQVRWISTLQHDFAARADWCVQDFAGANHAPHIDLEGSEDRVVKPGGQLILSARAADPDHDNLVYTWWQYREAGTFPGTLTIENPNSSETEVRVPQDARPGQTIHIILEVTDNGTPSLTRYKRVVIRIGE